MIIYRWLPHGSKKLSDLKRLNANFSAEWVTQMTTPIAIMHDQEPLQFDLWSADDFANHWKYIVGRDYQHDQRFFEPNVVEYQIKLHLRGVVGPSSNLYDNILLVHSEQNSKQVELYQKHGFVTVYYWSHALIAADWFRYAEHDPILEYDTCKFKHDFLIYNRAWAGSREYRLAFAEILANINLVDQCLTSFSQFDDTQCYLDHEFKNPALAIKHTNLHQVFRPNQHLSSASADYNNQDYAISGLEVVLETLFDDTRLHLTEKTLRPIACGKPFILAATTGSLGYLRSYGFETFDNYIDESYDLITDPVERLQAITFEMQRIASLPVDQKNKLWEQLHAVAKRNQQKFFSKTWQDSIEQEFCNNLKNAMSVLNQHCTGKYWKESVVRPLTASKSVEQMQALENWLKEDN